MSARSSTAEPIGDWKTCFEHGTSFRTKVCPTCSPRIRPAPGSSFEPTPATTVTEKCREKFLEHFSSY